MTRKPKLPYIETRHDMPEDGSGTWPFFDTFTGLTAVVNGVAQDGLDEVVAKFLTKELNYVYPARRSGTTH